MLAAELSLAEAQELIAGQQSRAAVAASNSHRSTVFSGDPAELTDLVTVLQDRGRFCRWVEVDMASHSPQMDALRADFQDMVAGLRSVPANVPMYSTVTGNLLADGALDGAYWVENLCSPVRISPAVRRLLDAGHDTFLELSPHPILLSAVQEDADDLDRTCTLLPSMRRDDRERATMLASLGTLYTRGQSVAWERLHPSDARCVAAPTYPWQRTRCWLDITAGRNAPAHRATPDRLSSRGPLRSAVDPQVFSEIDISNELMPVPTEHRVHSSAVLPAATLLKFVLAAAAGAFGAGRRLLQNAIFDRSPEGGKPAAGDARGRGASLNDMLRRAGRQERQRLLESYLRDQAASKLGLTPSRLDTQLPLNHLGVDSLIAVELRTQIERDLGIVVPVVQLLDGPSVAGLADWLGERVSGAGPAEPDPTVAADASATQPNGAPAREATDASGSRWMDLLAQVPEVSDDDVDELLREVLAAREGQDEG
jgi:acyl transferase domain-containing protein